MKIYKMQVVRVVEGARSFRDERRRCDMYIVAYRGEDGLEYRKAFEVKRGTVPNIPDVATHDELNKLKEQWYTELK
jgi:hypothetical protein